MFKLNKVFNAQIAANGVKNTIIHNHRPIISLSIMTSGKGYIRNITY
jgi:hypothetical protein